MLSARNRFKFGFGKVLGSIGRVWERSGMSLGLSWAPFGRFLAVQNRIFFKHGSKMSSKKPFRSILGTFGKGFGKDVGGSGVSNLKALCHMVVS